MICTLSGSKIREHEEEEEILSQNFEYEVMNECKPVLHEGCNCSPESESYLPSPELFQPWHRLESNGLI